MSRTLALALALLATGPACRKGGASPRASGPAAVRVVAIELGREVGLDKRVGQPTASFSPHDTIYVSVATEGSAPLVSLTARWSREGERFFEETQMIAPDGAATSEFHVWKPHGWLKGRYQVEVVVDGVASGSRGFSID